MNKDQVEKLYKIRFSSKEKFIKNKIWKILCKSFFQKYIKKDNVILDIASGYGEFINNIKGKKKIAIDINKDTKNHLHSDVIFYNEDASRMYKIKTGSIDVVFVSNFFEHLPSKKIIDKILIEIHRVLKKNGLFILMQPNIRYEPFRYWDYYDHIIPLSHSSLKEALINCNFIIDKIYPKFLPFSTNSKYPKINFLIWLYIKIPIIWCIFGKQCLIISRK